MYLSRLPGKLYTKRKQKTTTLKRPAVNGAQLLDVTFRAVRTNHITLHVWSVANTQMAEYLDLSAWPKHACMRSSRLTCAVQL